MKNADRCGAKFSVVIGDDEVNEAKAAIKNMQSGEAQKIDLNAEEICRYIRKLEESNGND